MLDMNLRTRLYKSSVCTCSMLTYGSEAWRLTPDVSSALNGANTSMVSKITGRDIRDEVTDGKSFDLVKWIRVRKLQWLDHILRMNTDRKIKQTVYIMHKKPRQGDVLMDTPKTTS